MRTLLLLLSCLFLTQRFSSTITYPQFVVTPDNLLQFVFRSGISGDGATQLAEYNAGTWSNVGSWASATGTYTSTNGVTSTARNLYIHGFTYRLSKAHVTGTWREQNSAVSCSSGGLTNHDTTYFYSEDKGDDAPCDIFGAGLTEYFRKDMEE